jgi:hypothetical protein
MSLSLFPMLPTLFAGGQEWDRPSVEENGLSERVSPLLMLRFQCTVNYGGSDFWLRGKLPSMGRSSKPDQAVPNALSSDAQVVTIGSATMFFEEQPIGALTAASNPELSNATCKCSPLDSN